MGLMYTNIKKQHVLLPSLSMNFNEKRWNPIQEGTQATNCYTYALDAPELGIINLGIEGRERAQDPSFFGWEVALSERYMDHLAQSDGLERVQEHSFDPEKDHVMALFGGLVPPTEANAGDFHFYRLDSDKSWSHQPGKRAQISKQSWNGDALSLENLWQDYAYRKCAWTFVGYYKVPKLGMMIEKSHKELNFQFE